MFSVCSSSLNCKFNDDRHLFPSLTEPQVLQCNSLMSPQHCKHAPNWHLSPVETPPSPLTASQLPNYKIPTSHP